MYSELTLLKFKNFVSRSDFGELKLTHISLNFKTFCCNLKVRGLGAKLCDVLKSDSTCSLLIEIINFNKNEAGSKWVIPSTVLERQTLNFLWWVGARERKKGVFFLPFFCPKEVSLTFLFYLKYIVYWIHFQNIYFYISRKLLHKRFCLYLKSSKTFSVSLSKTFLIIFFLEKQ